MKKFALACALLSCATPVLAQTPAAAPAPGRAPRPDILYASAADIQALIAKAAAEPAKPMVLEGVVNLAPYRANLEYRAQTAPAAVHETEAELMIVLDGAATIVMGGTMTDPQRSNPTNLAGSGITGGTSQAVAKGDFIFVPQNTPHQLKDPKGVLKMITFHVPRPAPDTVTVRTPMPDKGYISAADVAAQLTTARAAPPKPIVSEPLVNLDPYRVALEYDNMKGPAAIHETLAELMYIVDGTGDLVVGGTLDDEKKGPANDSGSGITGGTTYHLGKGDVFFVPNGIPHQVVSVAPGGLTMMTFKAPRPMPSADAAAAPAAATPAK
jgi:mannose-6-phosphate isomerase-like protein (cupin superfamily)